MDAIDQYADWIEKLRELRNHLAHIPYAARHQESIARPLAQDIEQAYQADSLPASIRALWEQHRATINAALSRANTIADEWDADFPVLKARPEGG